MANLTGTAGDDIITGVDPDETVLVSASAAGVVGNADSYAPNFSPDGSKVAFESRASNLVSGDTNGKIDIFVKDLATGAITRISTDVSGGQANDHSETPVFSPDGSKVVFDSAASNLVTGDTNGRDDIFVKDLVSGAITRVSTDSTGTQGDGFSLNPVFSPDGTKVAFESSSSNFPGAVAGYAIYVKDLVTGTLTAITPDASGNAFRPVFSPDWTKLAFDSIADNLVAGDTNGASDIFVANLASGAITRVSTDGSGAQVHGVSADPTFSADGNSLLFQSAAPDLVSGDTNGRIDIFTKDLSTGAVTRVSTDASGGQANDHSYIYSAFAPSGNAVAFYSLASNLSPIDANGLSDVFVKDLSTGAIYDASTSSAGAPGNANSLGPLDANRLSFAPDSGALAFDSGASNLVSGDTNGTQDVFVKALSGNDVIAGGGGDDAINGGGGFDTAVYSGNYADYSVNFVGGAVVVHDLRTGSPDGNDTLTSIESLRFADQSVAPPTSGPLHFTSAPVDTTFVTDNPQSASWGGSPEGQDFNEVGATYDDTGDPLDSIQISYTITLADGSHYDSQQALPGVDLGIEYGSGQIFYDWTVLNSAIQGLSKITAHVSILDAASNFDTQDVNLDLLPAQSPITSGHGINLSTGPATVDWSVRTDPVYASFSFGPLSAPTSSGFLWAGDPNFPIPFSGFGSTAPGTDAVLYDLNSPLSLTTGSGDDHLLLDSAAATVESGAGNDYIEGTFGGDVLKGGSGNDEIHGEMVYFPFGVTGSDDSIYGEDGNDTLEGGPGNDYLDGGNGVDTALYYGNASNYQITHSGARVIVTQINPRTDIDRPEGQDTLVNIEKIQFADQTIDITPATNSPPTPGADSLTTSYLKAVTVSAATLLANDADPDGNALSLTAVGGAQHGTVSLSTGQVTFTPFAGYAGPAAFTYTVDDGHGGTASGQVSVTVTGTAPAYVYRAGIRAAETIDTTGDTASHNVVTGSGDDTILTGVGGSNVNLGAGNDLLIGGAGKDIVTFGAGLDTVTGGSGPDVFIFVRGQIADPTAHGGAFDTVTDFAGAGSAYVAGRDFIYLRGFATTATITYEHDLAGDPTAHLYRIDDGAYHAEFVLDYAGPGMALSHSQYGFL